MTDTDDSALAANHVTVKTPLGSIRGLVDSNHPNVTKFLGVPYAEAPVGSKRWLPPVSKRRLGCFDATKPSLSCHQWFEGPASVYNTDTPEFRINDTMSEDCLSVSIWVPTKAAKNPSKSKLPVIVWLTGGAFLVGGSTVPYQDPTPWIETSQRHIVVSINYRLTIFGFPNAAGLAPHERNLGFLDQRVALEWVHKHIASFGGDPERMTHWGQSAGARSVDVHSFQYPDKPLVRNQIMNSGTILPPLPMPDPNHTHFTFVAKSLGYTGNSSVGELEFLRKQPADKIIGFIKSWFYTNKAPFLSFRPIVDGVTLFDDWEKRAMEGRYSKLPSIIGTNGNEGNALAVYNPDGVNKTAADIITKTQFLEPSAKMARYRSAYAPTFRYLYKDPAPEGQSSFPNISPRPWERAYHNSELPLIFGTHSWFRGPSTPLENKVSAAWQELYVAFAEDGPEGIRKLGWKGLDEGKGIIFGSGDKGWESVDLEVIDGA
ncbi:para-nitrobenzyl esterase [Hypomontagnella monticulosa]|nr:para-nitrobenzyl esterase [Hypomontagnella monticulosa]